MSVKTIVLTFCLKPLEMTELLTLSRKEPSPTREISGTVAALFSEGLLVLGYRIFIEAVVESHNLPNGKSLWMNLVIAGELHAQLPETEMALTNGWGAWCREWQRKLGHREFESP